MVVEETVSAVVVVVVIVVVDGSKGDVKEAAVNRVVAANKHVVKGVATGAHLSAADETSKVAISKDANKQVVANRPVEKWNHARKSNVRRPDGSNGTMRRIY